MPLTVVAAHPKKTEQRKGCERRNNRKEKHRLFLISLVYFRRIQADKNGCKYRQRKQHDPVYKNKRIFRYFRCDSRHNRSYH